jgi:hypothetical protein
MSVADEHAGMFLQATASHCCMFKNILYAHMFYVLAYLLLRLFCVQLGCRTMQTLDVIGMVMMSC